MSSVAAVALLGWLKPQRARFRVAALVVAALGVTALTLHTQRPAEVRVESAFVEVPAGPGASGQVSLDTSLYLPTRTPAPAVLLAHGFGGDKHSVDAEAYELAEAGFVVQTYTARGFGRSGGRIGLNDPDLEVADARRLLDRLARRADVLKDGPGDPKVAVSGASYGGALSLLLAGLDRRIDALVPVITYNDLMQALLPNSAGAPAAATPSATAFAAGGVFKSSWAGWLYSMGFGSDPGGGGGQFGDSPQCGRFTPEICRAYTELATTGTPTPALERLLHRLSPTSVVGRITAPTLLVQGEQDTLFGLDHADVTARQIARAGTSVQMVWYAGGHDGDRPDAALRARIADWLRLRLLGRGTDPFGPFEYQVQGSIRPDGSAAVRTVRARAYPGLLSGATGSWSAQLIGGEQTIVNPPGGQPAAVSGIPGLNGYLSRTPWLASMVGMDLPGQSAKFSTAALKAPLLVAGVPTVRLRVSAVGAPGDGALFVKLYDKGPDGTRTLPGNGVAAVRLPSLPADGSPVEVNVSLPGIVHSAVSGHELELTVATTDQTYRPSSAPAVYRVAVIGALRAPVVPGTAMETAWPVGKLLGIAAVLGVGLLLSVLAGVRRRQPDFDPALAGTPLVVEGLTKSYPGGVKAVDGLSFRVGRGQVLGLLGPNGAGKTTTLRMLLGLVTPTAGTVRVFGHRVTSGAPVLSRIGAFVEGAGFLPHLSGAENLRLYWAATGRPAAEARLDEALDIAGLGDAVERRVRTYSQGMRQRLAIAQAMLGLPDLLVLDEPTNGLDPPQIHHLRGVLRRYAATGRTVVVSSHLLAEVEQTANRVVVIHRGRVIADDAVGAITAGSGETGFAVDRPDVAAGLLRAVPGVSDVRVEEGTVYANLDGVARGETVQRLVLAGVAVDRVAPRQRLEEAFLRLVQEES
ncbi:alpha/beta fold hydrolase [Microbispora triticiradicis]|uniref:Alpha/beta fold hydrolase n=1 Tax=Microbispora triticiradicis TaxID=2200763 RepID=A0ABX9LGT0_9ACTN|nr:alpha/beta fold hydrolase [Microbispora triticiradicis]GLW24882.1 ABC transporter ATP-binding protein [Microbispora amethystogenes]